MLRATYPKIPGGCVIPSCGWMAHKCPSRYHAFLNKHMWWFHS